MPAWFARVGPSTRPTGGCQLELTPGSHRPSTGACAGWLYSAAMSSTVAGAGKVVDDRVVPPGEPWARVLAAGQRLTIIDLEGRQAVDFLCYNAANPEERYNAADTMKYAKTIFLTTGHGIYSDMGRPLLTIVADTCGRHDTLGGCCSAESNFFRYGVRDTPNCRDNFLAELARFGLGQRDI